MVRDFPCSSSHPFSSLPQSAKPPSRYDVRNRKAWEVKGWRMRKGGKEGMGGRDAFFIFFFTMSCPFGFIGVLPSSQRVSRHTVGLVYVLVCLFAFFPTCSGFKEKQNGTIRWASP